MSGEQRLLIALDMSLFARELAKKRIRPEHPDWLEIEVARELIRLALFPAPMPARLR
jgi:hypothetical protein